MGGSWCRGVVSWVRDSKVGWILRAVGLCKTRPLALSGDGAVPRGAGRRGGSASPGSAFPPSAGRVPGMPLPPWCWLGVMQDPQAECGLPRSAQGQPSRAEGGRGGAQGAGRRALRRDHRQEPDGRLMRHVPGDGQAAWAATTHALVAPTARAPDGRSRRTRPHTTR